jgi:hypothetical protein
MLASEILRKSAEKVDAGWVRHHFEHAGRVCALGALRKVAFGHSNRAGWRNPTEGEYRKAVIALADQFKAQGLGLESPWINRMGENYIANVNDDCAKNRKVISSAMEKAAIQLEGQWQ